MHMLISSLINNKVIKIHQQNKKKERNRRRHFHFDSGFQSCYILFKELMADGVKDGIFLQGGKTSVLMEVSSSHCVLGAR